MTSMATRPAPDISAKLADARSEAEKVRAELSHAENDLADALDRQDYTAAAVARDRADALRPHLALGDATVRALSDALTALDSQRQAEQAAERRQAREEAAQAALQSAMVAEAEAREDAERHLAAVFAGLDAIRLSATLAKQAESAGAMARREAADARAELAGEASAPYVAPPNWASHRIDRSAVLVAILRGQELS